MLKRLKYFVLVGIMLSVSGLTFMSAHAYAESLNPTGVACEALGAAANGGDCDAPPGPSVNNTLKLGINVFSLIVGVAAVIMIIVGGLKYILSQGESSNINSAKNTILYAIVGLVVAALAQVIVKFVLAKVTK